MFKVAYKHSGKKKGSMTSSQIADSQNLDASNIDFQDVNDTT